jgi:hypothetical protein
MCTPKNRLQLRKHCTSNCCVCRHTTGPSAASACTNDIHQFVQPIEHQSFSTTEATTQQPPPVTETSEPVHDCDVENEQAATSSDADLLLSDGPFQPQVNTIRPQHLGRMKTRVLHFQRGWFQKYKWLHYVPSLQGVPCFTCAKADRLHLVDLANKRDPAFITNGFRNWKKALERFRSHESSQCHNFSYMHAVAKN